MAKKYQPKVVDKMNAEGREIALGQMTNDGMGQLTIRIASNQLSEADRQL